MSDMPAMNSQCYLAKLLPHITALAREAGDAIMTIYDGERLAVDYKQDKTPLTQADIASHNIVLAGLARLSPDWPVVSEESAEIPFDQRSAWRHFWMVDPLDGTKEFLNRNGEFTVNIALIEDNTPNLGVVYAPAIDKMYFAARGVGAYKVDHQVTSQIRDIRHASSTTRVMVSRSHEDNLDPFIRDLSQYELIPMGSSLKFCLVAEGAAHLYPRTGPTMEWDTAAGHCILEVAGGSITGMDGMPLTYNKPRLLNPGFVAKASFANRGT
ncbi:MAG: 3'(2'),5'-bisphosphate nucleotidase CysQ [Terracidiphilus sp.]|jgi:3'(2'), 5'-bisphosphate nucleotidase